MDKIGLPIQCSGFGFGNNWFGLYLHLFGHNVGSLVKVRAKVCLLYNIVQPADQPGVVVK